MPLFKKSPSDLTSGSLLPESQRRVLRRCRMLLVKDLDVVQVVDFLSTEEGLRPDQRDVVFACSTREQRAGVLLDQLELRGERTFALFLEALKTYHKHLYLVIDEMLRTADDECAIERVAISGTALRRLLRKSSYCTVTSATTSRLPTSNSLHAVNGTQPTALRGSLSADESFDGLPDTREDADYIDCYTVSTHGRLQHEPWIRHTGVSVTKEITESQQTTYMAQLSCDLTFKRLDGSVPVAVRQPPGTCAVYVVVPENSAGTVPSVPALTSGGVPVIRRRSDRAKREFSRGDNPPPVPPKPDNLPSLSVICQGRLAPDIQPPPRTTSQSSAIGPRITPRSAIKPPVPKKKPHIIVCNGAVKVVDSSPASGQPRLNSTLGSDNDSSLTTTAADSSGNCDVASTSQKEGREQSNESTTFTCENDDGHSLNYNISACSTVEWVYSEEKGLTSSDADTAVDDNHYEAVTPAEVKPLIAAVAVADESKPLYSVVDKDRKTNRLTSQVSAASAEAKVVDEVDVCADPAVSDAEKKVSGSSSTDALTAANDVVERLSVSSEAAVGCAIPVPRRSSSYGDLPRKESSPINSLTHTKSQDPQLPVKAGSLDIILACDDDESSVDHSYYEDIDVCRSRSIRSVISYVDPHVSVNGSELDISGSRRLCRGSLLIVERIPAFTPANADASLLDEGLVPFLNTTLSLDRSGNAYYIPTCKLSKYGDPEHEPWFYPLPLTPMQATIFLAEEKLEGCFIVYKPASADKGVVYNLSVCRSTGDVLHYHIVENVHGDYSVRGHDHSFLTLSELVSYFQHNKSSLATRLRRPLAHARLPVTPGLHYDTKFELNRSDLTLTGRIIGKGNFGVICAGVYRNKPVAIKVLHRTDLTCDLTSSDEDDFIEEAKSLMALKHEQVLQLIGIVGASRPLFIVTEFAARGSLKECLRNGVLPKDNLDTLFDICIQVVSAMQYLESRRFMLHRDLAARNFLVTEEFCVKLADFGRARYVFDDSYQAPRNEKICIKWSPPEVLLDSVYSTKSDVWAMGVVFWEVLSHGERPYSSLSGEQTAVYVVEGGRLDKPPGCPPDLFAIMRSCWRRKAEDRPSFAHLSDKLRSKSSIYYVRPPRTSNNKLMNVRNSNPVRDENKVVSPSRHKVKAPNSVGNKSAASRNMRKSATASGDCLRLDLDLVDEMDRRIPVTSSSETSLTSIPGPGGTADDIGRGDRIRKSLRKLMNIKTNGKHRKVLRASDLNDIRSAGFGYT